MTALPAAYKWLAAEPGPRMLREALGLIGTIETPGARNNPTILRWAQEIGGAVADVYKADSIPWCGLAMAVAAQRAGWSLPKNPLWALSWSAWERPAETPMLGDLLVFTRNGGGHVALYVGEDASAYHCLGGNQSDKVCVARIAKSRLYGARRPAWQVAQPANVRPIRLAGTGRLSANEA